MTMLVDTEKSSIDIYKVFKKKKLGVFKNCSMGHRVATDPEEDLCGKNGPSATSISNSCTCWHDMMN